MRFCQEALQRGPGPLQRQVAGREGARCAIVVPMMMAVPFLEQLRAVERVRPGQ